MPLSIFYPPRLLASELVKSLIKRYWEQVAHTDDFAVDEKLRLSVVSSWLPVWAFQSALAETATFSRTPDYGLSVHSGWFVSIRVIRSFCFRILCGGVLGSYCHLTNLHNTKIPLFLSTEDTKKHERENRVLFRVFRVFRGPSLH